MTKEEILKAVVKVKSDYHELCKLKDMRIAELENEVDYLRKKCEKQEETLKKIRIALLKERVANIANYGQGGTEMFERIFKDLKGI